VLVGDSTLEGFEEEFVEEVAPVLLVLPFELDELAEFEDAADDEDAAHESMRRRRKWF
jgi:hypothetical protein